MIQSSKKLAESEAFEELLDNAGKILALRQTVWQTIFAKYLPNQVKNRPILFLAERALLGQIL